MLKKKMYVIIAAIVIVVLLLAGGGYFFLSQKKTQPVTTQDETQQVLTLSPDDIGLTIDFRSDNKAMKFTIGKAQDMQSIEYQISYTKDVKGEQVPEGLIGEVTFNPGDKTAGTGYREFGTCSSGVCRYDNVVSPITLTLKITKSDGKVYQVEKTANIPQ